MRMTMSENQPLKTVEKEISDLDKPFENASEVMKQKAEELKLKLKMHKRVDRFFRGKVRGLEDERSMLIEKLVRTHNFLSQKKRKWKEMRKEALLKLHLDAVEIAKPETTVSILLDKISLW